MAFRPKLFLILAAICISPLLILSLLSFSGSLKNAETLFRDNLKDEMNQVAHHYHTLVNEREREMTAIAGGSLTRFVRSARTPDAIALVASGDRSQAPGSGTDDAYSLRQSITELPLFYAEIAYFDSDHHLMFLVQPVDHQSSKFRTKDFLPAAMEPDEGVWQAKPYATSLCSIASHATFGDVLRCSVPIFLTAEPNVTSPRGALVADIRLDKLFAETDLGWGFANQDTQLSRRVIVLDSAGKIVYHYNAALRHQTAGKAMPEFAAIAASMAPGQEGYGGTGEYRSVDGETWLVAYRPVDVHGLWLSVARNHTAATLPVRRAGWLGIGLSILFGLAAATLLTFMYQRKTQSLESVSRSVAAIAGGQLDQELLLRSSDDMRSLADNVNLMTEQLREQVAREAEAHQFESFIKLSALLTHDLKNAIEGLSLLVGNMDRHFDNPKFRADAMRALTDATDKLRQIVSRLSHPVNTMSGEFKMPRPTDLVPLLQRVLTRNADPVRDTHEVEVKLPPSLMAMADGERVEKVMENLMLNAIEAMADKRGKLTIEAGPAAKGKVFFSISDTGVGMSPEFIQRKLFRPFATSKVRGVGLGLYTCREVIRANNGAIEVESKPGSGTTFRVVLASAPSK